MPKYKALVDIPPLVKAGDVVELQEKLIPEFEKKLSPVSDEEEVKEPDNDDPVKSFVTQPSRDDLKVRATELGINFASNVPTDRLIELIKEAEEKKAAEENGDNGDGTDDGDEGDGEE